jgi:hypothetical protein
MSVRQEFETWFASQFWAECYGDVKEHLFTAWKASRAAIVVQMPERLDYTGCTSAIEACRSSITAAGLQVKP